MAGRAGVIRACDLPADALLQRYASAYTDCFSVACDADLPALIVAFYTTPLFRVERLILRLAGHASTDADVAALANGADRFAAWQVKARTQDQILLCDTNGATRSWLCARDGAVFFGSAVVRQNLLIKALMPFHLVYSRALLAAAHRRLRQRPR